jgi:hypothetical protein
MTSSDSDRPLHRALRQLPAPRAPITLVPRVMAAIAAQQAAARSWFAWPLAWRIASIAALVLFAAGAVAAWPAIEAAGGWVASSTGAAAARARAQSALAFVDAVMTVASMTWTTILRPVAGYLLIWVGVMTAACAAFATAVGRIALGGASHS